MPLNVFFTSTHSFLLICASKGIQLPFTPYLVSCCRSPCLEANLLGFSRDARAVPPERSTLEGNCNAYALLSLEFCILLIPRCVTSTISTGDNYDCCRYSAKCLRAFGCPSKFSCLAQLWRTRGSDLCVPRQLAVQRFAVMHWCSAAAKRRWGLPGSRAKVQHRNLLSSTVENPSLPYITEWASIDLGKPKPRGPKLNSTQLSKSSIAAGGWGSVRRWPGRDSHLPCLDGHRWNRPCARQNFPTLH